MQSPPSAKSPSRMRRAWGFVLRWTLRAGAVGLVAGAAAGWFGWQWFDREILQTIPAQLGGDTQFRIPMSVQVYAADGSRVDQFYLERRTWVPIAELPPHVWQAFVAAEDRRFFEHEGVDPFGIARAFWVNLREGTTRQGGSTITQQLVKNLMVGRERSYRRKLREAVLASRLERELDKMALLELYVNYVALGNGNYGVEAAAQDYFGLSAREIDPGQAALLAGLVPAPSRYSPRHDPAIAAQRREQVLGLMVAQGWLGAEAARSHFADPVIEPRASASPGANAAYLTEVRREVRRRFGADRPFLEGLQIHTPLDPRVQGVAEQAVRDALHALEARQGARGAVRNVPPEARPRFLERGDHLRIDPDTGRFRPPAPGECFLALADGTGGRLRAGPFRFTLGAADLAVRVRTDPESPPRPLRAVLADGDVLDVCVPTTRAAGEAEDVVHRHARPWAEAAAVVLENTTGNVVALVGGYDVGLEGFVRATQARRQPGSAFKPFVYAAAVLAGRRQTDIVVDAPFSMTGSNGLPWSPRNYDGGYRGRVPLRTAIALSLNTVAVRLAYETGMERITRLAARLGIDTPLRGDLTVALGSSEVTPMDLTRAYAAFARGGLRLDPVWITAVVDRRGVELGRAGDRVRFPNEEPVVLPGGPGERVLPAAEAYVMVDLMRNVFQSGTARRGRVEGLDFGGKTGTTSDFMDAWFVGYSPRYTVGVWIGTDGTASLGDKETGGRAALPAWSAIMAALPNVPGERFPVPDEVVLLPVDGQWLGFPRGTAPRSLLPVPATDPVAPLPPFGFAPPGAPPELPPLEPEPIDPTEIPSGDIEAGPGGATVLGPVPAPDDEPPQSEAEDAPAGPPR